MTTGVRRAPHAAWRALAATVLVMTGAVGAHTAAGGHVPDGSAIIALAAVVLGASLLALHDLVDRRWLLPLVAVTQVGLHAAFSGVPAAGEHVHVGHDNWTWQMLLAHAGVTALTAVVWRLAERATTAVLDALPAVFHRVEARPRPRPLLTAVPCAPARRAHTTVAPSRGPPVLPRPA